MALVNRRRSNGPVRGTDLAELDARIASADSDLVSSITIEETVKATLCGLAADLGRGLISTDEYEVQKTEAEKSIAKASNDRERAETVAMALRVEAADLAETIARERVIAIEQEVSEYGMAMAKLDAERARVEGERANAEKLLCAAQDATRTARARYDPEARAQAWRHEQRNRRLARYWSGQPRWRLESAKLSPRMIALVKEEREKRRHTIEAEREALRGRSRRDLAALGYGDGDAFSVGYRAFNRVS